jgi:hypothetical protein
MTNQELMQLMTDMDLHEGGIENWVPDNAWLRVANAVEAREREACAKICDQYALEDHENWAGGCAFAIRKRGKE